VFQGTKQDLEDSSRKNWKSSSIYGIFTAAKSLKLHIFCNFPLKNQLHLLDSILKHTSFGKVMPPKSLVCSVCKSITNKYPGATPKPW